MLVSNSASLWKIKRRPARDSLGFAKFLQQTIRCQTSVLGCIRKFFESRTPRRVCIQKTLQLGQKDTVVEIAKPGCLHSEFLRDPAKDRRGRIASAFFYVVDERMGDVGRSGEFAQRNPFLSSTTD